MAEAHQAGDQVNLVDSMLSASLILEAMNHAEVAATLHGSKGVSPQAAGPFADRFVQSEAALRSRLGEDEFAARVARGKNMTEGELVVLVGDSLQALMNDREPTSNN
jgi:hypothetical protein